MKIKKFGKIFTVKQWNGEILGKVIAVDTETELIEHEAHTPRLVITTAYDGKYAYLITNKDVQRFIETHKSNHIFVLHNFAFDRRVLLKACGFPFWEMIENDRVHDTGILFKLLWIATKGFTPKKWSLDYCVSSLINDVLPKDNAIRLTFGQYLREDGSVDYKGMSVDHKVYALLDPIATYLVYQEIMKQIRMLPTTTNLAHKIHLMGDLALDDIRQRGIGVDIPYTEKLRNELEAEMKPHIEVLATYGWSRGEKGNQKVYEGICDFLEIRVPKSPKSHDYSMKAEDLEPYNHLPFVKSFLKFLELEHKHGFLNELTTERVHPYYDSIKNTARTSCKKPNIQNPPRSGGVRECFRAKKGHVFCDADYGSIEMYTAADCMKRLGFGSTMFDVLNAGNDPHLFAGSVIYNKSQEEVNKDQRQASKIANYGFLANMSEATFIEYAGQFGISFTMKESKRIKKGWREAYPEVDQFFKAPYKAQGTFISKSGFIRANCSYTAWLNTHFQGEAAEGAKIALYLCFKAGLPLVAFIHDEIMIEVPEECADEKLKELQEYMISGMKMVCNMNIKTSGTIRERHGK